VPAAGRQECRSASAVAGLEDVILDEAQIVLCLFVGLPLVLAAKMYLIRVQVAGKRRRLSQKEFEIWFMRSFFGMVERGDGKQGARFVGTAAHQPSFEEARLATADGRNDGGLRNPSKRVL
jgi:hypothetical protein